MLNFDNKEHNCNSTSINTLYLHFIFLLFQTRVHSPSHKNLNSKIQMVLIRKFITIFVIKRHMAWAFKTNFII